MNNKPISFIKNYYNFINNKSCSNEFMLTKTQELSIPFESQNIYSWLPMRLQFDNHIKQCAKISFTVANLFLQQKTWNNFASKMSSFSKKLINIKHDPDFEHNLYKQNLGIFSKYHTSSKIMESTKFVTEITNLAKTLQDGDKEALMVVIGDHVVNVLFENNNHKITVGYYDSYEGQLYSQYVHENDLNKIDETSHFIHPYSIFNPNNIHIGRVVLKNDSGFKKPNMGYIGWTKASLTKQNPSPKLIEFDKNNLKDLMKFLPSQLIFTERFSIIVNEETWNSFIKKYASEFYKNFDAPLHCLTQINNCATNEYTRELFRDDVIKFHNSDFKDIIYTLSSFPTATIPSYTQNKDTSSLIKLNHINEEICFKQVPFCYNKPIEKSNTWVAISPNGAKKTLNPHNFVNAEKSYFNVLYQDTVAIQGSINKCIYSENQPEQNELARTICSIFKKSSQNKFQNKFQDYCDFTDLKTSGAYTEKCSDPQILLGETAQDTEL